MKQITLIKITLLLVIATLVKDASAQGFAGFRTGKNAGVNGVFFNPASIARSNYKWDVNLGSIDATFLFDAATGLDTVFKKSGKDELFQDYVKSSFKINGAINLDVYGPSMMMAIDENSSIAITSRFRAMANATDVGGFAKMNENEGLYTFIGEKKQKGNINMWKEIGATFATTLSKTDKYIVTSGISAKYLTGGANKYMSLDNFSGTANVTGEPYLTNTYGRVALGSSVDDFEKGTAKGFGTDIGFVAERLNDEVKGKVFKTPYKYRLGVSILDIGAIKYHTNNESYGDYNIHIAPNEKLILAELDNKTGTELKNYLDNKTGYFTNNNPQQRSYTVSLPTSALVNFDWAINHNFFVDMSTQISLIDKDNLYSAYQTNYVAVTPRYEGRIFSLYLPMAYNEVSKLTAGVGVKFGPLFIGSNSFFTSMADNFNQVDIQLGLRLGLKKK
jgi:Family of unknown function (DUF5723)